MIYLYIWFETVGFSFDPPTEEDVRTIDSGELLVVEIQGTDIAPRVYNDRAVQECLVDTTPDGSEYHFVQ